MATLLTKSVLSDDEKDVLNALAGQIRKQSRDMVRTDKYYEGQQRLEHIGLAVPPELRHFETIVNVPRMAVDEPTLRQSIKGFYRAGDSTKEDPAMRAAWEANNLASESRLVHQEEKIFGRMFVAVSTNPDDAGQPLITAEDPRSIGCDVDPVRRRIRDMVRVYRDERNRTTRATLYRSGTTVHVVRGRNGWVVDDTDEGALGRDDHGLGVVPVVMFTNRRRVGDWRGVSEMADVIGKTDGIARLITNMQVGAEGHALPSWVITGASKADFVDRDGKPIPVWESYLTAIKALTNDKAKVQQFAAGDLKNFTDAVNNMLAWCATELGLPTRYAGQQSVNPAAEGAIRADESRLVGRVEFKNQFDGDSWAWVMGLEERFRTGDWGDPNSIRTIWFDPGTATYSQRADAVVKLRQVGALSIEGLWDELGWDEARKRQERGRLDEEARNVNLQAADDPIVRALRQPQTPVPADAASGGG